MSRRPRLSDHHLYDLIAPLYDFGVWAIAVFFGGEESLRKRVIEAALPQNGARPGLRLLEIFAGTASLSLMAAKKGAAAHAVDVSGGMLRVAREKALRAGLKIALARADAAALPFEDGAFDSVIVSMGLHEAGKEKVPLAIREAGRVLKKNGRFVIFDFHRAGGLTGAVQKIFFAFVEGETAFSWINTDLQAALRDAGFRNFNRSYFLGSALQRVTAEKA